MALDQYLRLILQDKECMDAKKKAEFVRVMGRQKFAKGGAVRKLARRKYFADGGPLVNTQDVPNPNTQLGGPGTGTVNTASNPNTGILGTIGGALGLNNNFQAGAANTQAGTNAAQLNQAYNGSQTALQQQQSLADTLNPQAAQAAQNQANLAQQLYGMTQGQGPNPALAELAQATAGNVAQTGAQMAGARGANQNVGLMARQIGQQGAATQQAAAGQAATLQAQQQIAAQQNLANLAASQIGQTGSAITGSNTAQQNEQNILQQANSAFNNNQVGMQSNINNTNAQTAQGNQGMAGKILGGVSSAISGLTGGLFAEGGEVEAPEHLKLAEMNAHAIAHGKKLAGGGAIGPNPLLGNQTTGGPSQNWAGQYMGASQAGGPNIEATPAAQKQDDVDLTKAGSMLGNAFKGSGGQSDEDALEGYARADAVLGSTNPEVQMPSANEFTMVAHGGKIAEGPHGSHVANYLFADGGKVPAMVSPGEIYLSPENVHKVVHEGIDPKKVGEKIPGKAKVRGDSFKNDTVPKTLEEGGVVIDRKNMGTKEKRELFVHRSLAKKRARK